MKFSEQGPDIPPELLDALLAGEVVFVCGAGVSAPQLPGFKGLVMTVFDKLDIEPHAGEEKAIEDGRFEEALGSLARRLVHESKMYDAASAILRPPATPDLSHHRTILRLSRDIGNRYSIVKPGDDEEISRLLPNLAEGIRLLENQPVRTWSGWWDRLWKLATQALPSEELQFDAQIYDHAINTTAGKLTESLLRRIDGERRNGGRATRANISRIRNILKDDSWAGHLGQVICTRWASYLVSVDESVVRLDLKPRLSGSHVKAEMLRAVLCEWAQPGAVATKLLKSEIIQGVVESRASDTLAQQVASRVLLPCLSNRVANPVLDWGIEDRDAARALRQCGQNIRNAAADCLAIWQMRPENRSAEEMWSIGIRPLFESIWPQEKKFKTERIAAQLALCVTHTGSQFPETLSVISPYLTSLRDGGAGLYFLHGVDVATRFPAATLDLLWHLLRLRTETVGTPDLAEALDEIKSAQPELELDRRFQRLETISLRFA